MTLIFPETSKIRMARIQMALIGTNICGKLKGREPSRKPQIVRSTRNSSTSGSQSKHLVGGRTRFQSVLASYNLGRLPRPFTSIGRANATRAPQFLLRSSHIILQHHGGRFLPTTRTVSFLLGTGAVQMCQSKRMLKDFILGQLWKSVPWNTMATPISAPTTKTES